MRAAIPTGNITVPQRALARREYGTRRPVTPAVQHGRRTLPRRKSSGLPTLRFRAPFLRSLPPAVTHLAVRDVIPEGVENVKASVCAGIGQPFETQEVEIASPQGREVLVEVRASGLCHSDLHLAQNEFGLLSWPAVLGHEVAGVVSAVGPDVAEFQPGDHVVACLIQFCGRCSNCLTGRTYQCLIPDAGNRAGSEGPRIFGEAGPVFQGYGIGGFAEQALIHENQLVAVPKDLPFSAAALLGCAVVTGAGSVINAAKVRVGESVVVIGTGGVGLNAISAAHVSGATRIVAVDVDLEKLELARKFGATDVVHAQASDTVEQVLAITNGGADHVFEVIGLALTQAQSYDMARVGGAAYLLGVGKPGTTLELDSSVKVLHRQKSLQGVNMGMTNPKTDIPIYAELYRQGRLNLDDLVSQEIGLGDINDAYRDLAKGGIVRSVITSF
ncbi:alcohol dehydrogenase catalytic domain-containing protein [Streptomyces carpinensis]|uniref:Alcohol dehydrogenase catalytic domain-containing protein n=1 Tax=Streptomyces carpinensis TaxID=66369 RepID=A0ABV1VVS0_9ACTN|nr:alcohol dehydrogenase catalytic domain-containing protein [Streptomyces carpinensis]